ncbi:lipopolysaccharide biosynthesis protein [Flavobacteriaceae bacterium]|nr:lipopolysaccharide biosynthesis protein [Flavobacteriaceae bacterium]
MKAKQEIKTGFKWSLIGFFFQKGLTLITGIVLARLLTPAEFGLLGMANVLLALIQVLVESGFGYTIIRTKELSQRLINTSLVLNVVLGIFFFVVFYVSAPLMASFFDEPKLIPVIELLSVIIVINSFRVVPLSLNIKDLKFKDRAKIDVISNVIGGIVGISMAYLGCGVKSLVWQMIVSSIVTTFAHNFIAKISYKIEVSIEEVKFIWKTSHRIFFNQILSTLFNNLNNIVIGKFFTTGDLGFYNRARSFQKLVQNSTVQMTQRAIFPVFAKIDSKKETLSLTRQTVVKLAVIAMPIILLLGAIADNLIIVLLTDKWAQSIDYLVLLSILSCIFVPQMVYINVLKANDDKKFFRSENISKIIRLTLLILTIPYGIGGIIIGQIIQVIIVNFVTGSFLNKLLNDYGIKKQLLDYAKPLVSASIMAIIIYVLGYVLDMHRLIELVLQFALFGIMYIFHCKFQGVNLYKLLKAKG